MNWWGHRFFQNTNLKLQRFLPYPLINFQGRHFCYFWLRFGRNDDLIHSFWIQLTFSAFVKLLNTRYLLFLAMCFGKCEFSPFFFRNKPGNFCDGFLITRFSSNFFRQEFNQFGISWKKYIIFSLLNIETSIGGNKDMKKISRCDDNNPVLVSNLNTTKTFM